MAIRWQIPFRTLRSNSLLTVNVYDNSYNGNPTQLTGGAQPFVTEEDDDDDWFAPVRTQSGYLSIVDTGKDKDGNPFNWRDFIPTTDTDRPITLTDEQGTILWQGFMQAQNFGSQLYEIPQERQFPVQCVLTVLSAKRMSGLLPNTDIRSFGSLLNEILLQIPTLTVSDIVVQDHFELTKNSMEWLFKKVCSQLFYDSDDNGSTVARYTYLELLEEICKYWGLTARTHRQTLYLMKVDDTANTDIIVFTRENLEKSISLGIEAVTSKGHGFSERTIGDNYANTSNTDMQMRGPSKATVTADAGEYISTIFSIFPKHTEYEMASGGFDLHRDLDDLNIYGYAKNKKSSFWDAKESGECYLGLAEFNMLYISELRHFGAIEPMSLATPIPVIRLFDNDVNFLHVRFQTEFTHYWHEGRIRVNATPYRNFRKYENYKTDIKDATIGRNAVRMAIAIGDKWWDILNQKWVSEKKFFYARLGGLDEFLWMSDPYSDSYFISSITIEERMVGKMNFEIYTSGIGDLSMTESGSVIDLANFYLDYKYITPKDEYLSLTKYDEPSRDYVSNNMNSVQDEYNVSCIFATYNRMVPGVGIVHNSDGSFYGGAAVSGTPTITPPEKQLADRVVAYWATSKRKIECELKTDEVEQSAPITPQDLLTIDGTTMWPIAISHDWRDDVTRITAMETYKR